MKVRFRRKSQGEWLVLLILLLPFMFFALIRLLGLPTMVKYVVDIGWCALLFVLLKKRRSYPNLQTKSLATIAGVFFFLSLIGSIINYQSIVYYLWGFRNNARMFVFFFGCIFFLKRWTADRLLRMFEKLYWVNFAVVMIQYFVLGYSQDFLGGIFGVEKGCNANTNIFLVIITIKSLLEYMDGRKKTIRVMINLAVSLIIAVFSELKIYFIEVIIISGMTMAMTKFSAKKIWIILGTVVGVSLATQIIGILFPEFANWFTVERMFNTLARKSGYTGKNDLNRLTAIIIVLKRFLPSTFHKLFGLGLGNCDYASFDFLTTPFYKKYGALNYTWFSSSFLALETGIVGLVIYIAFFVMIYYYARKIQKSGDGNIFYCQMARVISVISLILIIYNASLRTEAGFMVFFVLALPFINSSEKQEKKQSC